MSPKITISQGICLGAPVKETTLSLFLKQADQSLYESKCAGRDAVRVTELAEANPT